MDLCRLERGGERRENVRAERKREKKGERGEWSGIECIGLSWFELVRIRGRCPTSECWSVSGSAGAQLAMVLHSQVVVVVVLLLVLHRRESQSPGYRGRRYFCLPCERHTEPTNESSTVAEWSGPARWGDGDRKRGEERAERGCEMGVGRAHANPVPAQQRQPRDCVDDAGHAGHAGQMQMRRCDNGCISQRAQVYTAAASCCVLLGLPLKKNDPAQRHRWMAWGSRPLSTCCPLPTPRTLMLHGPADVVTADGDVPHGGLKAAPVCAVAVTASRRGRVRGLLARVKTARRPDDQTTRVSGPATGSPAARAHLACGFARDADKRRRRAGPSPAATHIHHTPMLPLSASSVMDTTQYRPGTPRSCQIWFGGHVQYYLDDHKPRKRTQRRGRNWGGEEGRDWDQRVLITLKMVRMLFVCPVWPCPSPRSVVVQVPCADLQLPFCVPGKGIVNNTDQKPQSPGGEGEERLRSLSFWQQFNIHHQTAPPLSLQSSVTPVTPVPVLPESNNSISSIYHQYPWTKEKGWVSQQRHRTLVIPASSASECMRGVCVCVWSLWCSLPRPFFHLSAAAGAHTKDDSRRASSVHGCPPSRSSSMKALLRPLSTGILGPATSQSIPSVEEDQDIRQGVHHPTILLYSTHSNHHAALGRRN
ncbi:hypothetical protein B0J11DRAFT_567846 [Dendryphion nanum]|uniref:Uncharacterized protein n=1 Tax=Dendryphion nanum TaxID=256645 RepID=A0A9P9DY40_9PLEO|nr:hypothetical protein B0J11DRAFT_567846 [Dendryphion nanum]